MKYTLSITQKCNLSCDYCYIRKRDAHMPLSVATKIIDFIYQNTPDSEPIDIGFFGGEPLLEFERLCDITDIVETHPSFTTERVTLSVVSNGTIFNRKIADYLKDHGVVFGISCDGPPAVHDTFRHFPDNRGSAKFVERTIKKALPEFPMLLVNAVYRPDTLARLPETVDYLSSLGLRQIYLNPDYAATWSQEDMDAIPDVYQAIAEQYIAHQLEGDPHFISLIDSKIIVIMRGGYKCSERCRMGNGEMAFTPEGEIFPCERLIGAGWPDSEHHLGHIHQASTGELPHRFTPGGPVNEECGSCSISSYCMNWCGCSNFFSTGQYNRVNAFLCASEKSAIQTAFETFERLESKLGTAFFDHLAGFPVGHLFRP